MLDAAELEVGLDTVLDELLLPAMRQIGTWWENGQCDVVLERVMTAAVLGWLARLPMPAPDARAPVIVMCGPRDQHTVGLEAFGVLLGRRRRAHQVLGPGTRTETLLAVVASARAGAAVVVSHQRSHRTAAVAALSAVAATPCPTYYAGGAFLFPGARVGVPGSYLGESLAGTVDRIDADLGRSAARG